MNPHAEAGVQEEKHPMLKYAVGILMSLAVAAPAFAKHHEESYPVACSALWAAVKDTLANQENYNVVSSDDANMTAAYKPKHSVHVTIAGAALQRTNGVTLSAEGTGCLMRVKSNYSGFEHSDSGDFKKRVEESLAKLKAAPVADAAKPAADPAK
jgi:hypothetical protein